MGETPFAIAVNQLARYPQQVPKHGPVYVLVLDSECGTAYCDYPAQQWDRDVPGWAVSERIDRFTLYEATPGQSGRPGTIRALLTFGRAFGPDLGYPETFAAAALLKLQGHPASGQALIRRMYAGAGPDADTRIRAIAESQHLNVFG